MARPVNVQSFIDKHRLHWQAGHTLTGIPPSVIIAQWGLESGWGSSKLYREGNSMVAIRWQKRHGQNEWVTLGANGNFAAFASFDEAVADWAWLLHVDHLSDGTPTGYAEVRATARSLPSGVSDYDATLRRSVATAQALGRSMYDAGRYGAYRSWEPKYPGVTLVEIILSNDLVEYDPVLRVVPYVGTEGPSVDPAVDPDGLAGPLVRWFEDRRQNVGQNLQDAAGWVKGAAGKAGAVAGWVVVAVAVAALLGSLAGALLKKGAK